MKNFKKLNLAQIRKLLVDHNITFDQLKLSIKRLKELVIYFRKSNFAKVLLFLLSLLGIVKITYIIQGSKKRYRIIFKFIPWPPV